MSSSSPSPALELRLRALESLIFGTPSSTTAPPLSAPPIGVNGKGVSRRTVEVKQELERLVGGKGGDKVLGRFVREFDNYHPLLFPHSSPLPTAQDPSTTDPSSPLSTSTFLPPLAKLSIILQAGEDITSFERDLREVEVLREQGVAGAGGLGVHEPLKTRLEALQTQHALNLTSFLQTQKQATSLLSRYSEYVDTMSELFVGLNNRVGEMEELVARLEKRKRDETAQIY